MKLLLLCGALLTSPVTNALVTSALPVAQPPTTTKIVVYFTSKNTFNDLAAVRQSLLAKDGILLEYEKLVFAPTGELQSITFRVDCRDGFQGSYTADNLSPTASVGFFRDYTEKAKTPFLIGKIF